MEARLDWPGVILATLGLAGMVFGFIESSNLGWFNPFVFGSLLLQLYAWQFLRRSSIAVPFRWFRSLCLRIWASVEPIR